MGSGSSGLVLRIGQPPFYKPRLMKYALHYLKDPKLWELRYIPLLWSCWMYISSTVATEISEWGGGSGLRIRGAGREASIGSAFGRNSGVE